MKRLLAVLAGTLRNIRTWNGLKPHRNFPFTGRFCKPQLIMPPKRKAPLEVPEQTQASPKKQPRILRSHTRQERSSSSNDPKEEDKPKKQVKPKNQAKPTKQVKPKEVKPSKGAKLPKEAKPPTAKEVTALKTKALNRTETDWHSIDFGCKKKNNKGKSYNLKITSWNVDGIRAWLNKDGLNIIQHDQPDLFCMQETKCSEGKLPKEVKVDGYHSYWCCSKKEGYAGVGVLSKIEPINVMHGIGDETHDDEGRCITLEFDTFYVINVYVPNSGRGLVTLPKRLEWNSLFKSYVKALDEKKTVILCGDMNVAHTEIDLTNPKTNKKNAGFTPEERDGMSDFLEGGLVDSFRYLYPDVTDVYTFWSYMAKARAKNVGWRLDYFIVSERIKEHVCDITVRNQVYGSDHCPITLFINI